MGLSSNQARFLSLTSRQVDLEHRIQQICQRRLRLSSELENVATSYNNSISNRRMFTQSPAQLQSLSIDSLKALGFKVINTNTQQIVGTKPPSTAPPGAVEITSQAQFLQIVSDMNNNIGLNGDYVLKTDIDMSGYDTGGKSLIQGAFTGTFDGNCYQIKNLNINNTDASVNPTTSYFGYNGGSDRAGVGLFEILSNGAKVSNLDLSNINLSVNGNTQRAGALAAIVEGTAQVSNVHVSDSTVSGSTDSKGLGGLVGVVDGATVSGCTADADISGAWSIGGFAGILVNNGVIQSSESLGSASLNQATLRNIGNTQDRMVGGLIGSIGNAKVSDCYSDASVYSNSSNVYTGGIVGIAGGAQISNTYTTGSVNSAYGSAGGFAGDLRDGTTVTNCYAQNTAISGASGGFQGMFAGSTRATVSNSFYDSSIYTGGNFGPVGAASTNFGGISSSDISAHTGSYGAITAGWDTTSIWDTTQGAPTLKNIGYSPFGTDLEQNLRSGRYSLVREADEFTQSPLDIDGEQYEEIDWRTTPAIYDELYKIDDVDAENKYDKTIEEINAQDKKLQLEQTSIEVEYKAISSEKESVKKILDTNAQNSFKYFS